MATEPRLASGLWVAAYLRHLDAALIQGVVSARGDPVAGAVLVRVATLDGQAQLWQRMPGPDGGRVWSCLHRAPEPEIDAALSRARRQDPDLWVIGVDDARGRHLLDQPGLA